MYMLLSFCMGVVWWRLGTKASAITRTSFVFNSVAYMVFMSVRNDACAHRFPVLLLNRRVVSKHGTCGRLRRRRAGVDEARAVVTLPVLIGPVKCAVLPFSKNDANPCAQCRADFITELRYPSVLDPKVVMKRQFADE